MAIALATQPTPSPQGQHSRAGGALDTSQPGFIKRFHQAANRLNGGRGVSHEEKLLLELLLSYDHPDPKFGGQRKGYVWPHRQTLGEYLKIGDRALRKHLAGLRDAGVIRDMTTEEVRRFQELGCDLRDAGRGRGWKIDHEQLAGLGLEGIEHDEAKCAAIETRLQELQAMPYQKYLQTPEWKARREQHLRSVGYRCQICNAGNVPLHVHHRTYERRGNEYFEDLVVLCEDCHRLYHEQGKLPADGDQES
jgi:5-methylcytosine-specific restriction endonuclease McrA